MFTRGNACREYRNDLPGFLDEYKHYPGLVVHWSLIGPSGMEFRPQHGGMLRAYTECHKYTSGLVKTIANTYYVANTAGNPHTFEYRCAPDHCLPSICLHELSATDTVEPEQS
jgi:hypothetical protein